MHAEQRARQVGLGEMTARDEGERPLATEQGSRDAMLAELASLRQVMDRAEHALREHDAVWLEEMLARAAQARADWPGSLK